MKKIWIAVILLLFTGCSLGTFELEAKDPMNCVKQIYKKGDTTYYSSYGTINVKFEDSDWMPLSEALDKKLLTIEEAYKKADGGITKCGPKDIKYPCGGGCN